MNARKKWMTAWTWFAGLTMSLALCQSASADTKRWDSKADWSQGTKTNVDIDQSPGDLRIFYDPTQQQYNKTRFIYIPNSGRNTVIKMDTGNGKVLWTYNLAYLNLGSNPSRTTVDTKGNVWIGMRNGKHVIALTEEGKYLASVEVGSGPRAVTIDKNGDIWAGAIGVGSIVKISGQTYKKVLTLNDNRLCSYGAATDSYGNVWFLNRKWYSRCHQGVTKIDVANGKIVGFYNYSGGYGLAADRKGYVWIGSYEQASAFQIDARNGSLVQSYPLGARARGVSVDANNHVWVACSTTTGGGNAQQVSRVVPKTILGPNGRVDKYTNVGLHTIGIAVDSDGFVWANSYVDGNAYKLRSTNGALASKHPVCDVAGSAPCLCNQASCTGCKCNAANEASPYTYSDMTGFQLQVIVAPSQGNWRTTFDARCKAKFSSVTWNATMPTQTTGTIRVRARTAATQAGLSSATWSAYVNKGQSLGVTPNRFIQVQFRLTTNDSRYPPIMHNAALTYSYYTEICDGIDNDCNGQTDETFPDLTNPCTVGKGICERTGTRICNAAKNGTRCSATPGQPAKEICDGKDNNCNGQIDEDWDKKGQSCTVGIGACQQTGQWICQNPQVVCSVQPLPPAPEDCNGKDDDCNGQIDDNLSRTCATKCGAGTQSCTGGQWAECSARKPTTEKCNDIDDDCDGSVDEELKRPCKTICEAGTETCVRGRWVFCDARQPEEEKCDGKDNDCDGQTDEDIKPKTCQGACGRGTAVCQSGTWSGCTGPEPEEEKCDGKDNDCNGKIDDALVRVCSTSCGEGKETCRNGNWAGCSAPPPGTEICDDKDNDCNGKIDDGKDMCPTGMQCRNGQCLMECNNNECPKGMQCLDGLCHGDPCKSIQCPEGKTCISSRCVDACFLVSCPKGETCEKGKCIANDCYSKGCPDGQTCINAKCEADPCKGVTCSSNEFCRDGKCISSCHQITCSDTERCIDGKCVKNPHTSGPCQDVKCAQGEQCEEGKCVGHPCRGVDCPQGRQCKEGACEHDPCTGVKCPDGATCSVTDGKAQCVSNKPTEPSSQDGGGNSEPGNGKEQPNNQSENAATPDGNKQVVDGGNVGQKGNGDQDNATRDSQRFSPGGCGCQLQHPSSPTTMLFLTLFLLLALRRRRRQH